jgi:hypothetical protein
MTMARTSLLALIGILAAGAASAQQTQATIGAVAAASPPGFGGDIGTLGPQQAPSQPRPFFRIFGLPIGVWAPVPAPYNVAANRNLASRPIE